MMPLGETASHLLQHTPPSGSKHWPSFELHLEEPDSGCHDAATLSQSAAQVTLKPAPVSAFLFWIPHMPTSVLGFWHEQHGHPAASKRQQEAEEKV